MYLNGANKIHAKIYSYQVRDHTFTTCAKFFGKLAFFTPGMHPGVKVRGCAYQGIINAS